MREGKLVIKTRGVEGIEEVDDREAHGHGQLLACTSKALSQNVLFYFRLRRSLRELRGPGTTLFLSYQPLYSELPHNALSLLCPLSTLESPLGRLLRLGPATVCKPAVFGRNGPSCGIRGDGGACGDHLCSATNPTCPKQCNRLIVSWQ